jgi:hypothetical protein
MYGHPALAFLMTEHLLEERRKEAVDHRLARSVGRARSLRLGRYRLTISREGRGVPGTL